jgi:hypothetical protein
LKEIVAAPVKKTETNVRGGSVALTTLLTAVNMKGTIFRDVTPCSLMGDFQGFQRDVLPPSSRSQIKPSKRKAANFVQWLRLALSKGPNWLAVLFLPHPWCEDGNRSSFRNVVSPNFLEYWTMDKVQKLSNSEQTSCFLLAWLTLQLEDGVTTSLRNISKLLRDCTASHPIRDYTSLWINFLLIHWLSWRNKYPKRIQSRENYVF